MRAHQGVAVRRRFVGCDPFLRGVKLALDAGAPRGAAPEKTDAGARGGNAREVAGALASPGEIGGETEVELPVGAVVEVPEAFGFEAPETGVALDVAVNG